MNINDKYKENRHLIKNGDFILFSGTGIIANTIKLSDQSYISHIGRVIKVYGRLLIVDSNANGNHPEWLSARINSYNDNSDFCIIRSKGSFLEIENNVSNFLLQSDTEQTRYDFINGGKELLNRAFGFNFKINLNNKRHICSQSVRKSFEAMSLGTSDFEKLKIAFPHDYIRHMNVNRASILLTQNIND